MTQATTASLDQWPIGRAACIHAINWGALLPTDAQRLREFGLIEQAELTVLHRGTMFSRDPLAVRVGRMRVILRNAQAMHIHVSAAADRAFDGVQAA
jgi:ferrous iron transport protein A